jgi:putative nucleotidyltransferase with HDIG domain
MSTLQSKGSLWELLLRLFRGSKASPKAFAARSATNEEPENEDGTFVLAPGGYRIRVPQNNDVNHCVGEMLPSVREGLSVLPPLPKVVTDLLREIQDPQSTAASVADIASSDPALAASLIRTVNAAAVGLVRKISSVSEAVSYLGFGAVKSMVVRLRLQDVLSPRNEQAALDAEDLWVHSLAVSYAADCLARRINGMDAGFAATLGLLHDIGKLAIIAQLPAEAKELNRQTENALAEEAKVLGVDHAGIGANLGATWKLPADLVQAIRFHHRPGQAFHETDPIALRQAVFVVHIANQLAKYCFNYSDSMEIEEVSDEAFGLLGLEPSLPKLLDAKMRSAIGRAVLLADANTRRSATTPRRFLRFFTLDQCTRAAMAPGTEPRIKTDDAAIKELLAETVAVYEENSTAAQARFEATADEAGVEKALKEMRAHQDAMKMSAETRSVMALMSRSLLPNLLAVAATDKSSSDKIEIGQSISDGSARLAIRCPALSASRRLCREATSEEAQRIAAAELGNVLNLGWFDQIAIDSTGSAVCFERNS